MNAQEMPAAAAAALRQHPTLYLSHPDGEPLRVSFHSRAVDASVWDLSVQFRDGESASTWKLTQGDRYPLLSRCDASEQSDTGKAVSTSELLAVAETALASRPDAARISLNAPGLNLAEVSQSGAVVSAGTESAYLDRELFWQQAHLWLPRPAAPFPLQYTLTQGRYHPRRPAKPQGVVYRRYIPWIGKTFSFRTLELESDLSRFNRWMNDPLVASFWHEEGDLEQHRRYLTALAEDPHMLTLIASFDDQPFAYFEVYWAKENRIAPFYDVDDYDRGWHVLVGEPAFRGRDFATAWLTSISHYLFLDDPRTRRVVGEPACDHRRQIRNLDKSGYAKIKEFDFPHKRALLVSLLRERYFGDGLWSPRDVSDS